MDHVFSAFHVMSCCMDHQKKTIMSNLLKCCSHLPADLKKPIIGLLYYISNKLLHRKPRGIISSSFHPFFMLKRTTDLAPFPGEPATVQHQLRIEHSLSSGRRPVPKNKPIFLVLPGLIRPPGLSNPLLTSACLSGCLQSIVIAFLSF